MEPEQHRSDQDGLPSPIEGEFEDSASAPIQSELSEQNNVDADTAPEVAAPPAEPSPVEIAVELEYSDRVNFAMQQHGVPLVDAVLVTSREAGPVEGVSVTLRLENEEAPSWTGRIDRLDPGATVRISPGNDFALSARAMAGRTEAERSEIIAEGACGVAGDGANAASGTFGARFPVELLAFDQWPGIGHYPELTGAFVTPNHPKVAELLRAARASLRERSEHEALDGYQSGSRRRATQIAEACFNALLGSEVGYINPPASFGSAGQRVRLADRLTREGMGTCLDLSLLLMGMWEQCGLHPLLLLPEGHAMPAVWTHEAHLPEATIDEPSRIRNLIELGEIVAVESTVATQRGGAFGLAVEAAERRMAEPGASFCAIDLRSARRLGVRPLPLRADEEGIDIDALRVEAASPVATGRLDAVELADRAERLGSGTAEAEAAETASDRITRWQTKLLDLSLRNRLLNFKETGRTLPLSVPDLGLLEDKLASGSRLSISSKQGLDEAYLREQLEGGRVYTPTADAETQKRLLTVYRTAKSSIEETGANMLYLTLGMLRWFETETSEQSRLAPLILLPARLHRSTQGAGYAYAIELLDEPVRANVTLLEKLRTEYGLDTRGLETLPEDETGVDVAMLLRNFRSAIRDVKRWEVVETAHLGLFSFNKFLMWRDLQENMEKLRANRLVEHLVERPGEDFDPSPFPAPESLDDEVAPEDLLCTRDADSSQLAAVRAASDGRTFVLEGPPGTGKSQTIANMVANSLARGMRVLFVAEKMAALSVVRKRLEEDGLGPFCLELHSAKASKKEVLSQLAEALGATGGSAPADWAKLCRELGATRAQLNAYVREMHKPRETGESLYRVLGRLSNLGDGPTVPAPMDDITGATAEDLDAWRTLVVDMQAKGRPVDPAGGYPLRGIGRSAWSFSLPDDASGALGGAIGAMEAFGRAASAYLEAIGAEGDAAALQRTTVETLVKLAEHLRSTPGPDRRLIAGAEAPEQRRTMLELCVKGRERDAMRADLLGRYREEFLELDLLPQIDAAKRASERPAVLRTLASMKVRRGLRVYCLGKVPKLEALLADLEQARSLVRLQAELAGRADAASLLGRLWNNTEADWGEIEAVLAWCERFSELLAAAATDASAKGLTEALVIAATDRDSARRANGAAIDLHEAQSRWSDAWSRLQVMLEADERALEDEGPGWLSSASGVLLRWRGALGELNTWCVWRAARDAAAGRGLGPLVELYEKGGCGLDELGGVFERSFGAAWFNKTADRVEAVRRFNASAHADAIARFRELDARCIRMTREVVAAKLKAKSPGVSAQASEKSEVGILRRELEKQRRHMPTRRLIEAIPNLLPSLKPCFLMSPLSVAQFLDAKLPPFDLVVFDEASQIPVWDAIGAIARGKEVVVVGDSKQLPPTNFFTTLDGGDEEEIEDHAIDDMESILKECNASGVPGMRLRWHYRSRHETLIAFSNHHYYQNELHTFPSPDERSEDLGVSLRLVEGGMYDRGGSRTNRVEAEAVVGEVVRMLRDPACRDSIGIVTFSQAQQNLIEDLLDEKRRELPEIEHHFTAESPEPVFVKNLENVQGDERDAIIFSVGYGPDQAGKVSMNFGPLNKEGGERRLNVAVTRARRRLMVFASMRSDQIDLRRTRAMGVRHFKIFLDYAERGPRAIAEAVTLSGTREFDSGFEHAVWKALVEKGWEVDTQVGCAGYRIDLAVRHPERPGRYLLGVECDGAAYHSAKTARDRDRLRQSVLEGLGWRIERVWSTEWRVNPGGCLARLHNAIEDALRSPEAVKGPLAVEASETATNPEDEGDEGTAQDASVDPRDEPERYAGLSPVTEDETAIQEPDPAKDTETSAEASGEAEDRSGLPPIYRPFEGDGSAGDSDIYDPGAKGSAVEVMRRIVEAESPVVESLAVRRLASAFGVGRMSGRFRERAGEIVSSCIRSGGCVRRDGVLWAQGAEPETCRTLRIASEDPLSKRDLDEISLVELSNGAAYVLGVQFGMPRNELVRETARLFGMQRVTSRVGERVGEAIDLAIERGVAAEADERVTPVE